jgi:hypothetical protein
MPRGNMAHLCATRVLKNAKFIGSVAPHVFPAKEPLDGYASIVPFEILRRFHRLKDEDLHGQPHLLEAAKKARMEWERRDWRACEKRTKTRLFGASPFTGTLHLVKATFAVGN